MSSYRGRSANLPPHPQDRDAGRQEGSKTNRKDAIFTLIWADIGSLLPDPRSQRRSAGGPATGSRRTKRLFRAHFQTSTSLRTHRGRRTSAETLGLDTKVDTSRATPAKEGEILRLICRGLLCFLRDMVALHTDGTAEKRLCFLPLRASCVAPRRLLLRLGSPISGRRIPHDPPAL